MKNPPLPPGSFLFKKHGLIPDGPTIGEQAIREAFKTPERVRRNSRNTYRRKNGIPEELPRYARAEPFNRKRRGSDNRERRISMPLEAWQRLDSMKGKRTRGETVATALELLEMTE